MEQQIQKQEFKDGIEFEEKMLQIQKEQKKKQ